MLTKVTLTPSKFRIYRVSYTKKVVIIQSVFAIDSVANNYFYSLILQTDVCMCVHLFACDGVLVYSHVDELVMMWLRVHGSACAFGLPTKEGNS